MAINTDDPQLFEHLTLIVDAFEKEAIRSGKRKGFMVAAKSPLSGLEAILGGAEKVLTKAKGRKRNKESEGVINVTSPQVEGEVSLENLGSPEKKTQAQLSLEGGVEMDEDLVELLGDPKSKAGKWLSECLGCDLRLQFDWQLKPLNLLGPISDLLSSIEAALDEFLKHADPSNALNGICDLLNDLVGVCGLDLLALVMALKMLLKRYMLATIEIKLDWTVVLGPILKVILDGLTELLTDLASVITAPLDCLISKLDSSSTLRRETTDLLTSLDSLFSGGFDADADLSPQVKNISWLGGAEEDGDRAQGRLDVQTEESALEGAAAVPVGFNFNASTTLEDAFVHPGFSRASLTDKIIIALREARRYIMDLVGKVTGSLQGLNALVSGGFAFNLRNLGLLMFVADMIAVAMMLYRLLTSGLKVNDWCEYMQENPQHMEQLLRPMYGDDVTVTPESSRGPLDSARLVIRKGPQLVGEISTCTNKRSQLDSSMLDQWLQDLELAGKLS